MFKSFIDSFPALIGSTPEYLLNDDFRYAAAVAGGGLNGTLATDRKNARIVADTLSKLSIAARLLQFAATGSGAGNPGLWYAARAREIGRTMIVELTPATISLRAEIGWDSAAVGTIADGFVFATGGLGNIRINNASITSAFTYTAASHIIAMVMRSSGMYYFILGGNYSNWTMIYPSTAGNAAAFPGLSITTNSNAAWTDKFVRVPKPLIFIVPLASDSFNRVDGAIGITDGAGALETGGSGKTWTDRAGTAVVSGNAAKFSALAGGIGISTVDAGTINTMAKAEITRSAGEVGLTLRWKDASNYIRCVHNGTNLKLIKMVAGSSTTLLDTAATLTVGARLVVSANATKFRCYLNDLAVGGEITIADADLQIGTEFGLYTSDLNNTLDNFAVWAKGNGGEYNALFNPYCN